jgi:hypothetical protein
MDKKDEALFIFIVSSSHQRNMTAVLVVVILPVKNVKVVDVNTLLHLFAHVGPIPM